MIIVNTQNNYSQGIVQVRFHNFPHLSDGE